MSAGASKQWEAMWSGGLEQGQAFDTGGPSNALLQILPKIKKTGRGFVPGCGRGYDAVALSLDGEEKGGREVVALDLSSSACKAAETWLKDLPNDSVYKPVVPKVKVVCGDFFVEPLGKFDIIFDATFLCALDPSVRFEWAARHSSLLAPDGELVCLIFPIISTKLDGPPYALTVDLVEGLLGKHGFEITERIVLPKETHMKRAEWGNEVCVFKRKVV